MPKKSSSVEATVSALLAKHFDPLPSRDLVTSTRCFPITAQLDVQRALGEILQQHIDQLKVPVGIFRQYGRDTTTFADLMPTDENGALIAPLQYDEVDSGDAVPTRCLRKGLWLGKAGELPCAVLLDRTYRHGQPTGQNIEIAVPPGEAGLELTSRIMSDLQKKVAEAGSYRGKVLSLESTGMFDGSVGEVKVHRLRTVRREDVILPDNTLALLERNLTRFTRHRDRLKSMNLGIKKGLLFYGPPGTGKTHTIHYLASQLPGHTTLLITAEQIALLADYVQLARFLQPAIVVIEDVDLIARSRRSMRSPCAESLLNSLLNEMDGLREDASVLFVLTTNRPEELEEALTSRPGRIDQAIEFPRPDEPGRRRLVALYSGELKPSEELINVIVHKTKGGTGAFIKELMRRAAQFMLEEEHQQLKEGHIESALDEMLFTGGSLNAKLLGMTP